MHEKRELFETNWCWDFIYKMHNRAKVSEHKYGDLGEFKKNPVLFRDELKNAEYRINLYKKDGNTEHLVDACNFLMFEYMEMQGYFKGTDSNKDIKIIGEV